MITYPDVVTEHYGRGLWRTVDAVIEPVPIGIGNVGAIGQHAAVAQNNLVTGTDPGTGAHQAGVAQRDPPLPRLASPYANLDSLTGSIDRGERMSDRDIRP